MAEKDFDRAAIKAEIAKQNTDAVDSDDDVIAAATKRMEALGFDPKADEIVPDDQPVPDEDLEDIDDDDDDLEDDELESDDEEDDDSTPEDDDEEAVDTDDDEVDTDEEALEGDEEGSAPQLSDAYYRAAIHSGMSDEDITSFYSTDPELAMRTFATMHESMNRASQEFADLGRLRKLQAQEATDAPVEKPGFQKIDTTAMRTELGDDVADLFDKQQEQFAELHGKMTSAVPVENNNAQELADQQTRHAAEKIAAFFDGKGMEQYTEVYGTVEKDDPNWTNLLPGAKMNRVEVIEYAEALIDGSAAAGREMSPEQALERAHLLVTAPLREKIIRKELIGKVVKRSKGITLKPSSKVADAVVKSSGPKTPAEIEDRAAARMAKMFGNNS